MADCGAPVAEAEDAQDIQDIGRCRTFEPLHDGDRQKEKRVAKARNPLQRTCFEVSLS
jgi:hypothetical protein